MSSPDGRQSRNHYDDPNEPLNFSADRAGNNTSMVVRVGRVKRASGRKWPRWSKCLRWRKSRRGAHSGDMALEAEEGRGLAQSAISGRPEPGSKGGCLRRRMTVRRSPAGGRI